MSLSPKAVRVFAAVEVLRDSQADVRHALATLFEPDLAKFDGQLFNPEAVAREINTNYRLGITSDIVAGFVDIFSDRGWILPILDGQQSNAFVVQCPPNASILSDEDDFKKKAELLGNEFRDFIFELSPLNQVKKSNEELVDDLIDWLLKLDRFTEDSIRTAAKSYKIGKKIYLDVSENSEDSVSESTFMSARFVEHLFTTKSENIKFLVELGEVGLITEVVKDFQRPTSSVKKTDLAVYLDAPLALDYLGLSGPVPQSSVESVLKGLAGIGGSVRIFRQSIEEMKLNLNAMLSRPPAQRTGPTADALRRGEVLEAFVRQIAINPDKILKDRGIGIVDQTVESFPNEHKYFSKEALNSLYSQIGWVKEDNARFHDAAIATLAMRKRHGTQSGDVFETKHVVLTRNPTFPSAARRISADFHYIGPAHVGPVIHLRQFATAIWLRVGSRANEEIPTRYILSSCRRVLTLRRNIVEKVHQIKSTLSDSQAEQLELLLSVDRSAQVLMDKTLGSAAIIGPSNIATLIDAMKKAQIKEHIKESEQTILQIRAEAAAREESLKQEADRRQTDLQKEAHEAQSLAISKQEEAKSHAETVDKVLVKIISNTNTSINRRSRSASIVAFLMFFAMNTIAFFGNVQSFEIAILNYVIMISLASIFYFNSSIRNRIFVPLMNRYSWSLLDKNLRGVDLSVEDFEGRISLGPDGFSLGQ